MLPAEVQRCLDVTYHMRHPKTCREVKQQVDPDVRQRIRALMHAGEAPSAPPSSEQQPAQPAAEQQSEQNQAHPGKPAHP